jgi:hypothetical protein
MGLDQYAGFRDSKGEVHDTFYWRKHSRLQVFFAGEYIEQNKAHTQKLENNTIDDLQHLGFNGGQGGVKITEELVRQRTQRGLSKLRCRRWFLLGSAIPKRCRQRVQVTRRGIC